jgi:hypothetical protein
MTQTLKTYALTIRGIDKELRDALKQKAVKDRRSLNSHILVILNKAATEAATEKDDYSRLQ